MYLDLKVIVCSYDQEHSATPLGSMTGRIVWANLVGPL